MLLLSVARKIKLSLLYLISKFDYPRIVKKLKFYWVTQQLFFYVLYNNFFYTRLAFVFDLQKDFIAFTIVLTLFSLQKILIPFVGLFSLFVFFPQKDFDTFHELLFEALVWHFHMYEKVFDRFFILSIPLKDHLISL